MTILRRVLGLCALVACVWSAPAAAQDADARAKARAAYSKGQDLFRRGDYEGAQKAFEEAYQHVPNPVVLLGIAEAQRRRGLWTDAVVTLTRYLKERPDAPDKAQVRKQLREIRARPAELHVTSTPPGAAVTIDGQPTGKVTPDTFELPAGDHVVKLELEGSAPTERTVTLMFGAKHKLEVPMEAEPAPSPSPPPAPGVQTVSDEPEDEAPAPRNRARANAAGWAAVGIGAAGLISGGVLGVLAIGESKRFEDEPTTESADRGEKLALFADVSFALALAGAVTAVVLFVTGDDDDEAPRAQARALRVSPAVGPSGGGVAAQLRF